MKVMVACVDMMLCRGGQSLVARGSTLSPGACSFRVSVVSKPVQYPPISGATEGAVRVRYRKTPDFGYKPVQHPQPDRFPGDAVRVCTGRQAYRYGGGGVGGANRRQQGGGWLGGGKAVVSSGADVGSAVAGSAGGSGGCCHWVGGRVGWCRRVGGRVSKSCAVESEVSCDLRSAWTSPRRSPPWCPGIGRLGLAQFCGGGRAGCRVGGHTPVGWSGHPGLHPGWFTRRTSRVRFVGCVGRAVMVLCYT